MAKISLRFDKQEDNKTANMLLESARAKTRPIDGCSGSLVCRHDEYCVRCGRVRCVKLMRHTRLYGYQCGCGASEWEAKESETLDNQMLLDMGVDPENEPDDDNEQCDWCGWFGPSDELVEVERADDAGVGMYVSFVCRMCADEYRCSKGE